MSDIKKLVGAFEAAIGNAWAVDSQHVSEKRERDLWAKVDEKRRELLAVIQELRQALEESVKLQSHYAGLLNMHDGGQRMTFTVDSWLARLNQCDGCRRGAPLKDGVHELSGQGTYPGEKMACTKERYG